MSEKLKKGIALALLWAAVIFVVCVIVDAFMKWLCAAIKKEVKDELREENDAKMEQLKTDLTATAKGIREENHQIARQLVDEVRTKLAFPAKHRPPGPAGFAGAEAEPI